MMKRTPLVSVIVPNYNYARFLRQRIDSILQQDFTDYELILLDDASSDDSRSILESYRANPHVACIVCNEQNTGSPFSQWQKGLALARGKYVWIAESDDYAETSFLQEMVAVLECHPRAVVSFAGSSRVDPQGRILPLDNDYWSRKSSLHKKGYRVFDGMSYIFHNLYWRDYIYNASGALFRREALEKADVSLCMTMHCSGDWLFWVKLAEHGQVVEVYKKLNYFRCHDISASTQGGRNGTAIKEDFRVVKDMEKAFPQIGIYRRTLRRGIFYKQIRRMDAAPGMKQELFAALGQTLGGGKKDFLLERANRYAGFLCPFLLTYKRDRL